MNTPGPDDEEGHDPYADGWPGPTDTTSLTADSDDPLVTSGLFTPEATKDEE